MPEKESTTARDVAEPRPGEKCPECGAVVFECAACEVWVCSCDGSVAPCHGCGRVTCPNCGHIKGQPVIEVERQGATMPSDDSPAATHPEIRREPNPGWWRLGTPQSAGRVDIALESGEVIENGSISEDGWATSDGTTIPRSEVAGWRPRARSDAAVQVRDGELLTREDALHLRELWAERRGFRNGYMVAVGRLVDFAAISFSAHRDEKAKRQRVDADALRSGLGDATARKYGDELLTIDFGACRALLLGETEQSDA